MSRRTMDIALRSRLYGLIAERPELAREDRGERIDATLPPRRAVEMSALDAALVERADEVDRMCGYAVAKLRSGSSAPLLDVLGMLDGDRLLAMYYALPANRQRSVRRDLGWLYRIVNEPEGIEEAIVEARELAEEMTTSTPPEIADEMVGFRREARRYRAGLDHELTDEQLAIVNTDPEATISQARELVGGETLDNALASMRTGGERGEE